MVFSNPQMIVLIPDLNSYSVGDKDTYEFFFPPLFLKSQEHKSCSNIHSVILKQSDKVHV